MNDQCEDSQVEYSSNIRLIMARQARLFNTYPMLSYGNVNCLYFIIPVDDIFIIQFRY